MIVFIVSVNFPTRPLDAISCCRMIKLHNYDNSLVDKVLNFDRSGMRRSAEKPREVQLKKISALYVMR